MSITDELRAWWVRKFPIMDKELHKDFTAIADRIDVEHDKALNSVDGAYDSGYNVGYDEGFASVDTGVHIELPHGWIRLPKDADNVPWNPGDCDEDGNVVTELRLTSDGWFVITDGEWPYRPKSRSHHHAQTVEDVLREMLEQAVGYSDAHTTVALDTIAEYAAKLKLAEGEDA